MESPGAGLHVYLIGNDVNSLVKIGKSVNPKTRISQLRTSSPVSLKRLRLYPDPVELRIIDLESHLHEAFRELRAHGEWFDLGRYLVRVDGVVENYYRKHDLIIPARWMR